MKANELRIGNFVNLFLGIDDNGANFRLLTIDGVMREMSGQFYLINHTWIEISNNIEPIPLTEEWLLKFGFQKRADGMSVDWHIGINEITHDWLFDIKWIDGFEYPFYRNGRHVIKYVHQLQNLYFALTGEELTLNK